MTTHPQLDSTTGAPNVASDGLVIQQTSGKLTGQLLYRVHGIEMPWCCSEREAMRVGLALSHAYTSGYFGGMTQREARHASPARA